jgi:hypothetical protein
MTTDHSDRHRVHRHGIDNAVREAGGKVVVDILLAVKERKA